MIFCYFLGFIVLLSMDSYANMNTLLLPPVVKSRLVFCSELMMDFWSASLSLPTLKMKKLCYFYV